MREHFFVSKRISDFYNQASEERRLNTIMGGYEFERVKQLIQKYILKEPSTILDIGGGTGKYAEWLALQNHEVHLVDPILKHIKKAESRAKQLKNPFFFKQGNAQRLAYPDDFADLVIMHGPLYHLQQKKECKQAIQEAKRVLKKEGILLGFAINYTASTIAGLVNGHIHNHDFFKMCKEELTTGMHNPPHTLPWLLAEAFYHRLDELKQAFLEEDFEYINTYAVEGITWIDKDYFTSMSHIKTKRTLNELLALTENNKDLMALSPHMMIAVKKS